MTRRRRPTNRSTQERLDLFCEVVDEAQGARAFSGGTMRAKLEITFGETDKVEEDLGDPDDVKALFVAFRHLVGDSEDTQLYKINRLMQSRLADNDLRAHNAQARARWKEVLHGQFGLHAGGRNYRAKGLWDLLANGEVFHRQADARAVLQQLGPVGRALLRQQVNVTVHNGIRVACIQRNIVRTAIAKHLVDLS